MLTCFIMNLKYMCIDIYICIKFIILNCCFRLIEVTDNNILMCVLKHYIC